MIVLVYSNYDSCQVADLSDVLSSWKTHFILYRRHRKSFSVAKKMSVPMHFVRRKDVRKDYDST